MTHVKPVILILLAATLVAACGGGTAQPAAQPTTIPAQAKATEPAVQVKATEPPAKPTEPPPKPTEPLVKPTEPPAKPTEPPVKPTEPVTKLPPTATTAPSPTAAPTQEEAPTGSAGLAFFEQTLRAQLARKAWRSEVTSDDAGKASQLTLEYSAPDRLRLATTLDGSTSENIVVGNVLYSRSDGGSWEAQPGLGDALLAAVNPKTVDELMKSLEVTSFKFAGPEMLGGRLTWTYDYATSMNFGGTTVKQKCRDWIGVADKLPYKRVCESDSILHPGGLTRQTTVYSYPSELKIEAPK